MDYWITKLVWVFGAILVIEESIYYCWNRYVYGKKDKRKWLILLIMVRLSLKLKYAKEVQLTPSTEKTHSL